MTPGLKEALRAFRSGDLESCKGLAELEISTAPTPLAYHLLGLAHCRLGDLSEGIGYLRAAANAEPGNAGFRVMLDRALVDTGLASKVLESPEPPPVRDGATLDLWRVRGEAADALQESALAAAAWSKVAAAAPGDWRAWSNLGRSTAAECRWGEAADSWNRAARLRPDDPSLRWNLALALAAAERHEEALAALQIYERLTGVSAQSAFARGRSLVALGRFEQAEDAYRHALSREPANRSIILELGSLLERVNKLQSLADLLAQAASAGVPATDLNYLRALQSFRAGRVEDAHALLQSGEPTEQRLRWNQLKAKVADRLGKSSEAYSAAMAMQRAVPDFEEWVARGSDYRSRLRQLADSLETGPGPLAQLDRPARKVPAFLVGFPRSGTTLLDTFLMGHPETLVLEEVPLLPAAEKAIGRVAELAECSKADLERARSVYFEELDKVVDPGFDGLVIDKLPLNLLGVHFIRAMFPSAPIILMERDPCDAVLSGFMQAFVMNEAMASFLTIEGAADLYDAVMTVWTQAVAKARIVPHRVRYERLVKDPESEVRPLIEFLQLDWRPELLEHETTAKRRGAILTPSYDQVTQPVTTRSIGRWRRYETQMKPVLPVLLPWRRALGYGK